MRFGFEFMHLACIQHSFRSSFFSRDQGAKETSFFFFFITLGPEMSDTKVYEP
jgi:hypothetical protein